MDPYHHPKKTPNSKKFYVYLNFSSSLEADVQEMPPHLGNGQGCHFWLAMTSGDDHRLPSRGRSIRANELRTRWECFVILNQDIPARQNQLLIVPANSPFFLFIPQSHISSFASSCLLQPRNPRLLPLRRGTFSYRAPYREVKRHRTWLGPLNLHEFFPRTSVLTQQQIAKSSHSSSVTISSPT